MFRFIYTIFINLFRIPYMMWKMRRYADHPEKYSEEQCYALAKSIANMVRRTAFVRTEGSGEENLPAQGGYLLYPNHQGKYDALGIVITHPYPLSYIIEDKASHRMIVREFTDLLHGGRIQLEDLKQTLQLFRDRAALVTGGQRLIIFPEGVYTRGKKNSLNEFKPGAFKLAGMAKVPIVPVVLKDSYKPFNSSCFGPLKTYVRYLPPIPYEEYAGMKTTEIAELVRSRIAAALQEMGA